MRNIEAKNKSAGQTLIETVVAIFVLTMGITAALGLATYSLSASSNITKQITAMALAREGVEAFKNMRDTNWLKDTLNATGCYNYVTSQNNQAPCYRNWLQTSGSSGSSARTNDKGYDLIQSPSISSDSWNYILSQDLDPANRFWRLRSINCTTFSNCGWGLNRDTVGVSSSGFKGYFYVDLDSNSNGVPNGTSDFYRKITLNRNQSSPYTANSQNLQRLEVISQVWWTDKKCPRTTNWPGYGKCSIEIRHYLTNWKNY